MDRAPYIARLAGPVMAAIGIGLLANQPVYREMARQALSVYPFIYFSGVLMLVAGLAILNAHHIWTRDWRSSVTLLGWLLCGVGTYRVIAPQFANFVATGAVNSTGFLTGTGLVLLSYGSFLTYRGYTA